ncbi:MAG: hypothetical protein JW885_02695 [Deltaproteobacteria bacterium]|nr:hypothetical protein [Candidatus Zymogenaceae bacterium]
MNQEDQAVIPSLNFFHETAMSIAWRAYIAKGLGDVEKSKILYAEALPWETRAADLVKDHHNMEPTRSVLYRSAASMAMNCGKYDEAERLIKIALEGTPPPEIKWELRDLRREIRKKRKEEVWQR